ncbi:PH domain-containing protein [Kineosporia succinea]|uniref:Membrane protein YdbT with pleckstrin-like domain n=1 Tax=Kineosporia succinea TaxID=84632 RepID=A0ABT9P3U2_9ACTN|nr:PH domain-containing protein [Kineosporia succinea]MDP9827361.1 putative membrane protein YdbT with pleckstrin-like domain [Kineosporia succinea]
MGFPTRLLAEDEQLVLVLRRHIKVMAWPILLFILLLALIGATFLLGQPIVTIIAAGVGLLIALKWVFWPFMVWWNEIYVITTKRLILRRGVLNRSGHDMPLTRLNDVSFEHGLIDRMFGCGSLMVETASESGQLILTDIPKVELVQRTLHELADDARGYDGRPLDDSIARDLDEAFGDEYRGPATADTPEDHGRH